MNTMSAYDLQKDNMAETSTGKEILQFIERAEHIESEKKDLAEQMKEVMGEAKGRGYCTKTIKAVMRLRKLDPEDIAEQEAVLTMYKNAVGMSS